MAATEAWLDEDRFLRIHRSCIVNLDAIKEIQPWFRGEYLVILGDGTKLRLSKTYRPRVEALLQTARAS